ncbi:MAG TPA: hypothetical protein VF407_06955 [Polyangiaceae bacterium]
MLMSLAITSAAQERPPPKKSKIGKVVALSGASVFGVGYLPAVWLGIGGAASLCPLYGRDELGTCGLAFARWAIPVAGPYLFVSEDGVHSGFDRLVVVDAVLQTAGAAALVTGIVIDLATPVAKDRTSARVDVVPMIGGAMNGAALVGSF